MIASSVGCYVVRRSPIKETKCAGSLLDPWSDAPRQTTAYRDFFARRKAYCTMVVRDRELLSNFTLVTFPRRPWHRRFPQRCSPSRLAQHYELSRFQIVHDQLKCYK